MHTANSNFDWEEGSRISVCLSHLRSGQIQLNTITGAQYSRDYFPKMPRPLPQTLLRSARIATVTAKNSKKSE